jgi:hypothetical protein
LTDKSCHLKHGLCDCSEGLRLPCRSVVWAGEVLTNAGLRGDQSVDQRGCLELRVIAAIRRANAFNATAVNTKNNGSIRKR